MAITKDDLINFIQGKQTDIFAGKQFKLQASAAAFLSSYDLKNKQGMKDKLKKMLLPFASETEKTQIVAFLAQNIDIKEIYKAVALQAIRTAEFDEEQVDIVEKQILTANYTKNASAINSAIKQSKDKLGKIIQSIPDDFFSLNKPEQNKFQGAFLENIIKTKIEKVDVKTKKAILSAKNSNDIRKQFKQNIKSIFIKNNINNAVFRQDDGKRLTDDQTNSIQAFLLENTINKAIQSCKKIDKLETILKDNNNNFKQNIKALAKDDPLANASNYAFQNLSEEAKTKIKHHALIRYIKQKFANFNDYKPGDENFDLLLAFLLELSKARDEKNLTEIFSKDEFKNLFKDIDIKNLLKTFSFDEAYEIKKQAIDLRMKLLRAKNRKAVQNNSSSWSRALRAKMIDQNASINELTDKQQTTLDFFDAGSVTLAEFKEIIKAVGIEIDDKKITESDGEKDTDQNLQFKNLSIELPDNRGKLVRQQGKNHSRLVLENSSLPAEEQARLLLQLKIEELKIKGLYKDGKCDEPLLLTLKLAESKTKVWERNFIRENQKKFPDDKVLQEKAKEHVKEKSQQLLKDLGEKMGLTNLQDEGNLISHAKPVPEEGAGAGGPAPH